MIRVLVVDDQRLVRAGWCGVLTQVSDIAVVGEARSGQEAIDLALTLRPDVMLMDVTTPGMDGLEATYRIHKQDAKIAILMIDMTYDAATVRQALEYGARGYIAQHEFLNELVPGVRAVYGEKHYFSPAIATMLSERRNGDSPGPERV